MAVCETCTEGESLIIDRLERLIQEQQQLQQQVQSVQQQLQEIAEGQGQLQLQLQTVQQAMPADVMQAAIGPIALRRQVAMGDLLVMGALLLAVVFMIGDRVYRMLRGVLR